jgi:hypothetical protein
VLTYTQLVALERSLRDEGVLSVYVHGGADDPAARLVWRRELDRSLRDLRRWLLGSLHEEREQFERSVERLGQLLAPYGAGMPAPGFVAFITAELVHDTELLPVEMPTMAVWSTGMCVAPYIRALKATRPVVVALVDARSARIFRHRAGELEKLETIHAHATIDAPSHMSDVPRAGFHPGVRGEPAHDSVQRAYAVGTERMLRQAEATVVRLAGRHGWVLVGGIPGVAARFTSTLGITLPARVRYVDTLDIHASDADISAAAHVGASTLRDAADLRVILDIIGDDSERGRVAIGPAATRAALERSCVRDLYLTHGYVEEHTAEAEEMVRQALDQGAAVEEVSRDAAAELDAHGGVGARLRYRAVGLPAEPTEQPSATAVGGTA